MYQLLCTLQNVKQIIYGITNNHISSEFQMSEIREGNSIFVFLRESSGKHKGRNVANRTENRARQRQIFELIYTTIPSAVDPRTTLRTHQPRIQSRRNFMAEFTVGHIELICESR